MHKIYRVQAPCTFFRYHAQWTSIYVLNVISTFKILCMRNVKWKGEEKNNLLKSAYISIRVWAHGIYLVLCQLSAICNKKPTDRQLIIKNWIFESAHKTVQIHLKIYSEESNTAKNPKMLKWNIIANNSRNH